MDNIQTECLEAHTVVGENVSECLLLGEPH